MSSPVQPIPDPARTRSAGLLLLICYLGFISLGLPDTLLGVAWPFIRGEFGLSQVAAAAAFTAMGIAYGISGSSAGRVLAALGTGRLLVWSSAAVSLAVAGYALSPVWPVFVVGGVLHGLGSGAIDTGLNHFVSRHYSARHMNWLHACFSLGAAAGPAVMTYAVGRNGAWRAGYGVVGSLLLGLTLLFFLTRRKWGDKNPGEEDHHPVAPVPAVPMERASLWSTLQLPAARWHLWLFFVYAGIESTVGQWSFTLLTEGLGVPALSAGAMVTGYWSAIFAGRLLSGGIVARMGSAALVRGGLAIAAFACCTMMITQRPLIVLIGLLVTGLAIAPVFPCLMTLTPLRMGSAHAANAIGLQVTAATVGIAFWPSMGGLTAQHAGAAALPWLYGGMAVLLWLTHESGIRGPTGYKGS